VKGKQNDNTQQGPSPLDLLESPDGDDSGSDVNWADVESGLLARLIDAVSRSGGIATLGLARGDSGLYCSVRFGDNKRAWVCPTAESFGVVATSVIGACARLAQKQAEPTPLPVARRTRSK
jgi:hypothetical protein